MILIRLPFGTQQNRVDILSLLMHFEIRFQIKKKILLSTKVYGNRYLPISFAFPLFSIRDCSRSASVAIQEITVT